MVAIPDFWRTVQELDERLAHSSFDEARHLYETAMGAAFGSGRDAEGVYIGGRLAELLACNGLQEPACNVYAEIWSKSVAPLVYGLEFIKLLLKRGKTTDASRLLEEMRIRLQEEKNDPDRSAAASEESLSLLLAEGLLTLKHNLGDRQARLADLCARMGELRAQLKPRKHIDLDLLTGLVQDREYVLARTFLDFVASVRP